jgi:serine/threonine-protein kinase
VAGDDPAVDAAPTGLKVMDFGIAKVLEGLHGTNTQSIGTLQYMSPEQIDARTIDPRSDLYSLGLIFYEMLAGAPPFSSASPRELLNLQCTAAPPPLDEAVRRGLPRGVEELLFAMLEKKPDARPPSAREVIDRLSPFRSAVSSSPPPASPRTNTAPLRPASPAPAPVPAPVLGPASAVAHAPAPPRTDTVAVALAAAKSPEVPTWIAVVAIVALSLVAGMTTYLVRLRTTEGTPPPATAIATPKSR